MVKKIEDEFTDLPISRTRKNQLRHIRDGLCEQCHRKNVDGYRCQKHLKKNRTACAARYRRNAARRTA